MEAINYLITDKKAPSHRQPVCEVVNHVGRQVEISTNLQIDKHKICIKLLY